MFNACEYLLDRRVAAGDSDRVALTGAAGELTYAQLLNRVHRAAAVLRELGLQPEQRLLMFMADSPDLVAVYLAAMRIGAVPVPVSTMLHADGLAELLRDSRAPLLMITPQFSAVADEAVRAAPELRGVLLAGAASLDASTSVHDFDRLLAGAAPDPLVYSTTEDSPAFWLYTSGTTGAAKAAMHRHGSVRVVCETYGEQVLRIGPDDRCLSAAKAFFAYGLGNSVLFPLSVGASVALEPAPSRPDLMAERVREYGVTLFFAGPTFFAGMLRAELPGDAIKGVRLAASAGEALPAALYQRWTAHFGVDVIDGIGMTEMLHIFLSNRAGEVRPGTTGTAVPGYDLKILDDGGAPVPDGSPGTLYVRDAAGYYTCLGRTGDMLKTSGMWVSPAEVEERLLAHPSVSQAIVVAGLDADGLEKPVAYVIVAPGATASEDELIAFCKEGLPSFKRPRKVVFVDTYPTTSTGKVRRVELRQRAATVLEAG